MTRTMEEIREIVERMGYHLLNEYSDNKNKMRRVIIQDFEGFKYNVYFKHIIKGHIPEFVGKGNPFTLSHNIPLWLKKENKQFALCEGNTYEGNRKKLFFQCLRESCQEIFDMTWNHIYNGGECPFCRGYRVGKRNNLAYLRPDLAKEWDYENNYRNPEDYVEFSNKKVSWICSKCGYSWDAKIYNRSNGRGCQKCSDLQKESSIANKLKTYLKSNWNAISEYKLFKNPETGYWLPYDIYIPYGENPELNGFYIEVHSDQHYRLCYFHKLSARKNGTTPEEEFSYQKHKDKIKKNFAKKNGVYIEIDLRKIKTTEEAIEHIENVLK